MPFILVVTKQDNRSSPVLLCRRYVSSDKSEQFQPLFDLGGSFISCNTHSAESCNTRLSSRFEFQVRHLHSFLKYPTKNSKDSKIPILHFHCWKSNNYLCKCVFFFFNYRPIFVGSVLIILHEQSKDMYIFFILQRCMYFSLGLNAHHEIKILKGL